MDIKTNNITKTDSLYSLYIYWNPFNDDIEDIKTCAESLCNIFGFDAALSVKLIYESIENNRALVYSDLNVDNVIDFKDKLENAGIKSVIGKLSFGEE